MTEALRHVTPGEPFRPNANAHNAFVDAARIILGQRKIFSVPEQGGGGGSSLAPYRVTTVNCILDGYSLNTGALTDGDGRKYVKCKRVDDTVLGTMVGDEVDLYCDWLTPGFVAYGFVLLAENVGGKLTARTALRTAWSELVSVDGDVLTLNLFADVAGFDDHVVEAESALKCSGAAGAPGTVDQLVKVEWEQYPAGTAFGARLFSYEWCCPPT